METDADSIPLDIGQDGKRSPGSDLTFRAIAGPEELGMFMELEYSLDHELAGDLSDGHRRPEWLWVALRGGRVVARAGWWSSRGEAYPSILDFLDVASDRDRVEVGVALLRKAIRKLVPTGSAPPDYVRFVPPDWKEHRASREVVEDRMAIAAATGAVLLVERLRLEWLPGTSIPAPTGRLAFRGIRDDAELIELMTLVMEGTLDAHSRADMLQMSPREAAVSQFEGELALYPTPRAWWRVATLPDGEPVGFVIPAHNSYHPIIAYIGVLPVQRGHHYIDEILAEGTRVLRAAGVPRIRASTDLANVPMAQAFYRLGWTNFERQIDMTWK